MKVVLIDFDVIQPLLDRYEELEGAFKALQALYEKAERDGDIYFTADERKADLNELAAELLGDMIAALRREMETG